MVGQEDGKVYGRHPSRKRAQAQMRALYANVRDAKKEFDEAQHPRAPAGSAEGGEFTAVGGGAAPADPATMTAGEVNRELAKLAARASQLTDDMIAAGRGSEKPSETRKLSDPLSRSLQEVWDRLYDLRQEIRARTGTDYSTMPRGFKPRVAKPKSAGSDDDDPVGYDHDAKVRHWETLEKKLLAPMRAKTVKRYNGAVAANAEDLKAGRTARAKKAIMKTMRPVLTEGYLRGAKSMGKQLHAAIAAKQSWATWRKDAAGGATLTLPDFTVSEEVLQGIYDRFGGAVDTLADKLKAVRERKEGVTAADLDAALIEYAGGWGVRAGEMGSADAINAGRNDVRDRADIKMHEWLNRGDDKVRETHEVYGDLGSVPVGYNYAKAAGEAYLLRWPYDDECEEFAEIGGCRCVDLPSLEGFKGTDEELNTLLGDLGEVDEEKALDDVALLKLASWDDAVFKFNPDQPREPAGSPEGGEWTSGGSGPGSDQDIRFRPTMRHERVNDREEGKLPTKKWSEPPKTLAAGHVVYMPKGYASSGHTNNEIGDKVEASLEKLGFRKITPEGDRRGRLDVEYKRSGIAFEVKAVTSHGVEYKAKSKEGEIAQKIAYGSRHSLKAGIMLAVVETRAGKNYGVTKLYWKMGLGQPRLTQAFKYTGRTRISLGKPTLNPHDFKTRADKAAWTRAHKGKK